MKKLLPGSLRSVLSKLKFAVGQTPHVENSKVDPALFIPAPHRSVCLISADFELAWAFRFSKASSDPVTYAVEQGMRTRKNIPVILRICEEHGIPITWATVGHLFLTGCKREGKLAHPEIKRLDEFANEYWSFSGKDWFADDPCTDYKRDPAWYCPDLIEDIISRQTGHEIGCHTFSHIDCRDSVCSREVFFSELQACQAAANSYGLKLRSFVHPGHQTGHLADLAELGYTSFRTDQGNLLAYPRLHKPGIWEFPNTAGLEKRGQWSESYQIRRYLAIIDRAIRYRKLCVLWFHPSFDERFLKTVFAAILDNLDRRRQEIACLTHGEYAEWLNLKHGVQISVKE